MRLLLFFAVVAGLIYWAYYQFTHGFSGINSAIGKVTATGNSALTSAIRPPGLPADSQAPRSITATTSEKVDSKDSRAARIYRFKNRNTPVLADLQIPATVDASLAFDPFTRSAFVSGSPQGVAYVMNFLEQIDLAPGSCAVQSWAVFVDKSAQKGFDLVAAINAVIPSENTVTIGSGGLTLDVGGEALSAALNAICDGSTVEAIQRPHVQLTHGKTAKIESLQEVPVPSTAVSQGIAQTSVEYRKVGLQLEIVPSFLDHDRLSLAVTQSNGLIGQNVKIDQNEVPVIQSQSVSTTVEMTVGQTVILGGVSTLRQKHVRGLLRDGVEVSEGSLYVILSTYYDAPRAVPIVEPARFTPQDAPPIQIPMQDPVEWIDGQLLPSKGWLDQERDFIRDKSADSKSPAPVKATRPKFARRN